MKRIAHAVALLSLAAGGAHAQTADLPGSAVPSVRIVPTLAVSVNATNNVDLSPTDKQSDLFFVVSPGINISSQSGRVRGFLDYTLNASLSARSSGENTFTNALAANVRAEAVEKWMFVDASASISQQVINPFGTQSPNPSLTNPNRTEVSTVNVSPFVEGQIAGQVNYLGRAFYTYTDSGTSQASNSNSWGGLLRFDSTTRWSRLGWAADFSYRDHRLQRRPRHLRPGEPVLAELRRHRRAAVVAARQLGAQQRRQPGRGNQLRLGRRPALEPQPAHDAARWSTTSASSARRTCSASTTARRARCGR